jgi:transposase
VDYDYVHDELQRDGVTLLILWEEYRDQAMAEEIVPKSYTTFCRGYRGYVASHNVTNHLEHRPGQVMEVDWNGTTMRLVDEFTGEVTKAHLFVVTLPYSQYSYVEATQDMRQNTWIKCHIHAWDFFGGVAVRTVCDNLKTGVISHPREGEIVLNAAYEALGRHYMTAIMPTGVRKPKQKPSVEGTCGMVATAIVARLRNRTFHTLEALNSAIREMLDRFNAAPFQKREGSRLLVFEDVESAFLSPLPKVPFEVCDWVYGRKVAPNFHVSFEKNYYSVPHALVGRKVDVRYTDTTVEVYDRGERVATHARCEPHVQWRYRTDSSHMPPRVSARRVGRRAHQVLGARHRALHAGGRGAHLRLGRHKGAGLQPHARRAQPDQALHRARPRGSLRLRAGASCPPTLPLRQVDPGEWRVQAREGRRVRRQRIHPRGRLL